MRPDEEEHGGQRRTRVVESIYQSTTLPYDELSFVASHMILRYCTVLYTSAGASLRN